jgi:hypothetical protein
MHFAAPDTSAAAAPVTLREVLGCGSERWLLFSQLGNPS